MNLKALLGELSEVNHMKGFEICNAALTHEIVILILLYVIKI